MHKDVVNGDVSDHGSSGGGCGNDDVGDGGNRIVKSVHVCV